MRLATSSAVAAAVLAVSAFSAHAAPFTRIPTLGGNNFQGTTSAAPVPVAINANGVVVGGSQNAAGNFHAYTYATANGTLTDLGVLPNSVNGAYSYGYGINGNGQVAGAINVTNYSNTGYVYTPGSTAGSGGTGYTLLGTANVPTANAVTATGVNNSGVAVGTVSYTYANASGGTSVAGQAFAAVNNQVYSLGSLGGTNSSSSAYAVNNNGLIVGGTNDATNAQRAFRYALTTTNGAPSGTMTLIPTLGGTSNIAYGVNDNGDVVGWSAPAAGGRHAFVLAAGASTPTDLTAVGRAEAYGTNNLGEVVGYLDLAMTGANRATLWSNGQTIDLDAYYHADPTSVLTYTLLSATSINDAHQVVGIGRDTATGQQFNYVLSVPEPTSLAVLGLAALAGLRRRR